MRLRSTVYLRQVSQPCSRQSAGSVSDHNTEDSWGERQRERYKASRVRRMGRIFILETTITRARPDTSRPAVAKPEVCRLHQSHTYDWISVMQTWAYLWKVTWQWRVRERATSKAAIDDLYSDVACSGYYARKATPQLPLPPL